MKRLSKKIIAIVSAVAMVVTMLPQSVMTYAAEPVETAQSAEYEIYPTPHEITYAGSNFVMSDKVNVVYEEGIDADTKARLDEVLALQKMTATTSDAAQTGDVLNILVGIKGSEGYVDEYVNGKYTYSDTLFNELDSYYMAIDNGTIVVLGKDTDAAFYGLTSLYHIFTQVEGGTIENLQMEDYADVASRGFIEGYYGNPWSTEDRCNLMEWGGYYKLNSYFYAPKDDPKHNAKWKELYTAEEIETKIKPLAEAGNKSKCRFVYALHPYMYNAIRYSSDAAYEEDMNIMKAKFTQVIEAGVRQIAILADDAGNVGGSNYIRTLTDMTAWIKEMQKTYPDLKLLLPFCTQEYMGNGQDYYSQFPENIQIVMTGGRVWGECSDSYTTTFKNNVGRGVYLWINWPCTDNSKKHLIMGGYSTFLHPGVNPDKVQGIVLNPMQQSEPSKVAIFGNACYTWNIWETAAEADQAWEDSFDHVDHKSYKETAASTALKELSKHMINQNMDSRVTALQESVVLKDELNSFKAALEAGTVTKEAVDSLIEEFEILQNASVTYRNEAGDANIRDQIVYWLNCWDDTTAAAIAYLNAINAYLAGDDTTLIEKYFAGQTAFASSKTYGFHYVDHTEYAEVGVQHIVPFIKELGTFLANEIKIIVDPNALVAKYISNRYTTPASGDVASALDGNDGTSFYFTDPLYTLAGDYIGVSYNRGITVNSVRILMGNNKNQILHSKLQYLVDEENAEWTDIEGAVFERTQSSSDAIEVTGLNIQNVKAVRLIATADNLYSDGRPMDSWLEIKSIDINKKAGASEEVETCYTGTVTYEGVGIPSGYETSHGNAAYFFDQDTATEVWVTNSSDQVPANATITITFDEPKAVGKVKYYQGQSAAGDVLSNAKLQYRVDGTETWVDAGVIDNTLEQEFVLGNVKNVKAVRILNVSQISKWLRISGIEIYAPSADAGKENVYANVENDIIAQALTGATGVELSAGTVTLGNGDYIGVKFDNNKALANVAVAYTEANANVKLQASHNGLVWFDITAGAQTDVDACYVRLVNTGSAAATLNLTQFAVEVLEVGKKFHSCDVAVQWGGDNREDLNVFDGNMSTTDLIDGGPLKDQSIVYDLGQKMDIHSLRIYAADSLNNYIRDAVVQVSSDLTTWTDLFEIGDGITISQDEGFNLTPRESFPNNDSNYPNYVWAGSDELNVSGRYLRILFTADCTYRGVAINEIMINNGEYTSIENNKDFVGTLEVQGYLPSYMTDGDLLSSYKASAANGSITYRLAKAEEAIRALRVIQNGTPSNAKVTMSVYDGTKVTEVEVGTLAKALNEFVVPEGKTAVALTITWETAIPEIMEIISCYTVTPGTGEGDQSGTPDQPGTPETPVVVNKAALATAIAAAEALKAADYTAASYAAVQTALTAAKAVNAKADATQADVDAAATALNNAVKALVKATTPAPQPAKKPLKKGQKFTKKGVTYQVTKSAAKNGEVAYVKTTSKAKTITVPKTVEKDGITYKVTSIAKNAFKKNTKTTKIVIGENVKTIGASAFEGCTKLATVTIGKNVTTIGDKAFKGCKALKSVTIPAKVSKIGKEAFQSCGKLTTITVKATNLKSVGKNAFKGIKSNAKIKVPAKKYAKYKTVLKNKGQGKKVKITK